MDVFNLYSGPLYSKKEFSLEISSSEFPEVTIADSVKLRGVFYRVEGGIQVHFDSIKFSQKGDCGICGKKLLQTKEIKNTDWTYYEKEPVENEDFFEHLMIDTKSMKIDISEAVRQEVLLNYNFDMTCSKPCRLEKPEKESKDKGHKALAKLKEMWKQ